MVMTNIPSDATWHKKQTYIWFRGGDLNILEIIGHFLFKGDGAGPPYTVMIYIPSDATWHKDQEYVWFRVGISTVFEKFGHFLFVCFFFGGGTYLLMLLDTRNKNIYLVKVWRIQSFSRYRKYPLLCPHPTPGDDDFNKLAFVLCLKTFMQIWALWANWFLRRRSLKYVPFTSTCKNHNLYKHYVRKFLSKSELFWLSGSREDKFQWPHPIFAIISPWTRTWPFI
jgi:hypothetical protein